MKHLDSSSKKSGFEIKHFNSRNALKSFLIKNTFINSAVLVKGSRGMKMEEFVNAIEAGKL
jgi:UDP-N-acetylmuramyl pentapeptide synthase